MTELVADVRGAGPAVVLLHGQPGSGSDWEPVTVLLEAERTVIVPDRPGYGRTGGRARGFRGNAAAVVALLDRLGIERAIVVGHSWGGGVAIALAEHHRSRVRGLVLVSSVSPDQPLSRLDRALAMPPIGQVVTAAGLYLASLVLAAPPVRGLIKRRHGSEKRALAVMIETWREERVWDSFVTEQRSLVDELPLLGPGLASIATPTVVIVGDADRIVPPTAGRQLAARIPHAELVELAGAGHLLAHERPQVVVDAVRQVSGR